MGSGGDVRIVGTVVQGADLDESGPDDEEAVVVADEDEAERIVRRPKDRSR
jgi:hypothetical protein